jgi:hypothetical protein
MEAGRAELKARIAELEARVAELEKLVPSPELAPAAESSKGNETERPEANGGLHVE